jgi:hypothetical protein
VAAGEIEILLEVDGFGVDEDEEMTMTKAHINI